MKKEFNRNDLAAIKRAAANIAPLAAKRDKLTEKIEKLMAEREDLNMQISYHNMPIQQMTGFNVEDLVERGADKKFVLKYPDTIVPDLIPEVNEEEAVEVAEAYDERAEVDEVETAPADAPFNPIN